MRLRAFTAWDLLLGLAVVFVLIAFLIPVPAGNPARPGRTCLSNLKGLAIGVIMYGADHDDRFPHRDQWMDAARPYTTNEAFYHCPTIQVPKIEGIYGYAYNSTLTTPAAVENPAATPMIYDSINLARNASDPVASIPATPRHEGVNNIAHVDGSAKGKKK